MGRTSETRSSLRRIMSTRSMKSTAVSGLLWKRFPSIPGGLDNMFDQ